MPASGASVFRSRAPVRATTPSFVSPRAVKRWSPGMTHVEESGHEVTGDRLPPPRQTSQFKRSERLARVAIPSSGIGKFATRCLSSYSSSYRAFSIAQPTMRRSASLESREWWSVEWERYAAVNPLSISCSHLLIRSITAPCKVWTPSRSRGDVGIETPPA